MKLKKWPGKSTFFTYSFIRMPKCLLGSKIAALDQPTWKTFITKWRGSLQVFILRCHFDHVSFAVKLWTILSCFDFKNSFRETYFKFNWNYYSYNLCNEIVWAISEQLLYSRAPFSAILFLYDLYFSSLIY